MAPECWTGIYSPKSDAWAMGVLLCFLLFSTAPFGKVKTETLKFSEDGEKLHAEYIKRLFAQRYVSDECKDLIKRLLSLKLPARLSIEEALSHSWVTKYSSSGYVQ